MHKNGQKKYKSDKWNFKIHLVHNFFFTNITMKNVTEKPTFLSEVYMIVDQSIRDLHIILVTERCDMSYVISYFTQENVFIVAEIVFQSSCM